MMEKLLGLPVLASEHGKDVDNLIIYVHWLMIVLFVGWVAYFIYVLIRFRKSRNPTADYVGVKSHASNYIEGGVALAEGILLIGFAVPLWAKAVDRFPNENDATTIRVIAQQFGWNMRYPGKDGIFGRQDMSLLTPENPLGVDKSDPHSKDDIQTLNEMHVPVNKAVIIHLTSKDVIHSFKVIALRVCQDAIPGMQIPLWFKPLKEGRYQINCAQLCGAGHYNMSLGMLTVESQEKFDKWQAEQSKAPSGGGFE
ncbi:MAG: cytochrome c oxidase subunit II [Verrucomicrobiota bacterium]